MITNAWKLNDAPKKAPQQREGGADIFGNTRTQRPAPEQDLDLSANEEQLLKHIRARIAARGARGIAGIGKKFKIADDNNSKTLDVDEFKKAMHDFRIGLSPQQVTQAFRIFDRDGSGEISFDEFLRTIRGALNDARAAIARKAYAIMDSYGSGQVDINDIR